MTHISLTRNGFDKMDMLDKLAKVRGWRISRLGDLLRESKTALAGGATPRGALYPDDGPKFVRVQNVKPMRLKWNLEIRPMYRHMIHTMFFGALELK